MSPGPTLRLLEGSYAVAQLEPSSPIPSWAEGEGFVKERDLSRAVETLERAGHTIARTSNAKT